LGTEQGEFTVATLNDTSNATLPKIFNTRAISISDKYFPANFGSEVQSYNTLVNNFS